jgi:hypothetical protein
MRDSAREVAALVDRGAERYALGDVSGAAALWREARTMAPDDLRVRSYLEWAEFLLQSKPGASPATVARRTPTEEEALSTALAAGMIADDETTGVHGEKWNAAAHYPSLADSTDSEPTRQRDSSEVRPPVTITIEDAIEEPTKVRRSDQETPAISLGEPWSETTPTGEGIEREFMSRVETHPNLDPLEDVPELTDDAVNQLAAAVGVRPKVMVLPGPKPEVLAMVAQSQSDVEVIIEMEADEPEPLPGPEAAPRPVESYVESAREAVERGDLAGAFDAAERLVAAVGGIDAPELIAHSALLGKIYEQQLGDLERTVIVAAVPAKLDPRAAFLLSRVDGLLTIEDLHDVSGMPWLEAIRLLALLLRQGALAVR